MAWLFVGVVVLAAAGASASPWLKQQPWWPWRGNRKGGG